MKQFALAVLTALVLQCVASEWRPLEYRALVAAPVSAARPLEYRAPQSEWGGVWLCRQGKKAIPAALAPVGEVTNLVVRGFSPTFSLVGGSDSGLADGGFALTKDIRIADRAWLVGGLAYTITQGDRWRLGLILGVSAKF